MSIVNFGPHKMTFQNINMQGSHGNKLRIVDIRIIVLNESALFKADLFIIENVKQHVIQYRFLLNDSINLQKPYSITDRCRAYILVILARALTNPKSMHRIYLFKI